MRLAMPVFLHLQIIVINIRHKAIAFAHLFSHKFGFEPSYDFHKSMLEGIHLYMAKSDNTFKMFNKAQSRVLYKNHHILLRYMVMRIIPSPLRYSQIRPGPQHVRGNKEPLEFKCMKGMPLVQDDSHVKCMCVLFIKINGFDYAVKQIVSLAPCSSAVQVKRVLIHHVWKYSPNFRFTFVKISLFWI
jgi:hypothetical protein